ncbi:MAG: hypothetical protein VW547_10235, partial [Alphaproteobacteria bacterium]
MPEPFDSARNRSFPSQNRGNGRIPASLERLHEHIRRIEGYGGTLAEGNRQVLPFGIEEIDSHLPGGGLARGALHEVFAADKGSADAGIATAFCALLAGRLVRQHDADGAAGGILWCERPWTLDAGALYPPALLPFGIDPARVILVRARRDDDTLWAMEEGLRCPYLAAVVGEVGEMSLTASRRLQLAAGESGVAALMLRPRTDRPAPSAAATRWRLGATARSGATAGTTAETTDSAPPGLGAAHWQAEMFRCRGGAAAPRRMEWDADTGVV